jgi:broad specificity phosphatase PhoE
MDAARRVALVRHAESTFNAARDASERGEEKGVGESAPNSAHFTSRQHLDAILTPLGEEQCVSLAQTLKFSPFLEEETEGILPFPAIVFLSPLTRALQTFELGVRPALRRAVDASAGELAFPVIRVTPELRERRMFFCDDGRSRALLVEDFPLLRSELEEGLSGDGEWWTQQQEQASPASLPSELEEGKESEPSVLHRAREFSAVLRTAAGSALVVGHADFFFFLTAKLVPGAGESGEDEFFGQWLENCETFVTDTDCLGRA